MTAELEIEDSLKTNIIINVKRKFSSLVQVEVEPVGKWFHLHEKCRSKTRSTCEDINDESSSEENSENDEPDVEIENDITYLRTLDPADWKNQDHYAVLGLKNYRYKASDDDIKKAYRMMVLKHHPDKRKGAGEEIREGDDYFACITKAYEILGVPVKRRGYDSIDSDFDDSVPSVNTAKKNGFFETFSEVIERNVRWSTKKHVPLLGDPDDLKPKVDKFYNFWYDFDSWREFSYLDEEEKEKGQDRDERRWIEKQNKAERARRKKEEMARIRKLVDNCYNCDPRIAKFKEEEKERRLAIKKAKQDAVRQKIEEQERLRLEEEERIKKLEEQEKEKQKAILEAEKKERELAKKAIKKEKKTLRLICKEKKYFTTDEAERVSLMTHVEWLCEALNSVSLNQLNASLSNAQTNEQAIDILKNQISSVKSKNAEEREPSKIVKSSENCDSKKSSCKNWSSDEIQMLIKAVNVFPAGTNKRWEVVAEYLNQHCPKSQKNAKEVLNKAKELQTSDQAIKDAAKKKAFQGSDKNGPVNDPSECSIRLETPQEMLGVNLTPWSTDEQQLLEQALKTYSNSVPNRWDKISECIPNRTKKECMKRYKELAEMVKAKKAALHAADKK